MRYEDFNCDIGNEGFISDAFKKLFGKKKEDTPKKTGVKITRSELRSILTSIDDGLQKDCKALLKSIESKHSEFFKSNPEAITFSHNYKESVTGEWDNCIAVFFYDLNEVVTPNGKGMARMIFREELPVGDEIEAIMNELISGLKPLIDKHFSNNLMKKGIKISADSLGDWDDGDLGFYFENIDVVDTTEGTEALKDIVKKVAKKAADKAGILPAGNINVNKNNIKGFHQAARVLLNYGQSRELINRSFKGIDIKKFGSKANLDAFMNSIKPAGKFHVAQGWLIFDLMETNTYKLKNDLNKEDWGNMYDAAEMITKKANYTTIKIIKELFGSRGIELHPNPIGHLLSKNGTKSRLMFKLGKVKIEDGTFENSNDLVDRIRFTIGAESFDPELTYEDEYALEDAVENVNSDYEFFEAIGIESEMIAIAETFGEIEDLNEMIAIESVEYNYLNSLEGLEAEIDTIISTINNLEISLESLEEGTEGFKEVANEIVKQGRKLIKAILRYFNIGLSLHEQGLKTAEIIRKVSKKTISELKTLPKPAQEKFEFRTSFISMTQYYMNKVYSNNNKSFPLVALAENINRVYNAQGRKFNEGNIVDFSKRFDELSQISIPQELADMAIVNTRMNYDQTLMTFGELLGIRGEHAARKCTGDVEAVIEILKAEINNVDYSPKLIEALKNWLKGAQSVVKPYKTMLINLGRATKGLTKDIASAIRKSKAAAGIESIGFESSIKDTDTTQSIVDEILSRMEQDPILKLAKDKELIEIKVNPNSKRKVSINFKEIKEIEKILTPEDIQKYGGSTYQFLLKLSDTFNKNIMWNMKEIEETAKSGGNNLDAEAVESLKGRGYYIYKGIESLDDLIEEMLMMENGLEDFNEFKDSAKAWIKKAITVIMDFLSKDKVVYFFQVRNFQDIQKRVRSLNEYNMDDYDLYVLGKISGLFSDLNKSKSFFYRKLKDMNFNDGSSIKFDLKGLKGVSNKVKTLTESIDNIYNLWKDKYQRNPNRSSKKGTLNTVKSTILKMKFEYIDVRQNFLKLENKIEEGALSKSDEEALRAFLNLSKSMQSAYLKGATKAMKMIRKMLYDPQKKPSNESFSEGIEDLIEYEVNWDWIDIETKGVIGIESKYDPHPLYKGIMDKAEADITKIAKKVAEDILKTPEYKEFKEEVERKAKKDDFLRKHMNEVLKINGNYVESTYTSIELISYDEEVYYMDSWDKLESAIVRELNKYADKVFCKPGYKWVFDKPADDQPQFTAYIKKVSSGTEGLGNDIKDMVESSVISAVAVASAIGIVVGAEKLWGKTPWGKKQVEARIKKEIEKQEREKEILDQKRIARLNEEARKLAKATYEELVDDATDKVKNIAKEIIKKIPKMSEFTAFKNEIDEKSKSDEFVKEFKDDIMYISADDVSNYDFGISALDFSQNVYLIDAWNGLSKAIINEMNKHVHEIPCKPGYKWVFNDAFDDESCFWCILQYTGNGATESIENEDVQYNVVSFEDVEDFYKDRAHYRGSFSDAIKIIKNGIVAFIKPFTPSGRREALKKKEEEQKELEARREKAAKRAAELVEASKLYDQYINKALPIAKREAEKIIKMLPNFPKFKALVKEVSDYGKEHDWNSAVDCISYYVDGSDYGDEHTAIISYDQDLIGFDNHYDLEAIIIKRLEQIANKIPHPDGFHWTFSGPYDDEACIWMFLDVDEHKGTESFDIGEEGIFDTIKQKWKDGIEKQKARREKERKEREEAYRNKQKASNSSKVIKTLSSTAELNKLQSNCIKVVKSIYDEVKSNVSKAKLDFIELAPFDKDDAVDILNEYGDYQLEFHFLYYATPKWTKDNHDEVFEQEEKLWDIIESAINKHKDKFGVPIEYYGVDGNLSWGLTDGYIRVSEDSGAESEIVQAIYDEFGTEGITRIIKRFTK